MEYIALDSHKRYSFASVQNCDGTIRLETRVEHHPGAIHQLLCQCESAACFNDEWKLRVP